MTPVDKGRFCASCEKSVMDFTGMSDTQLIAFFKKPSTGSVCGRFFDDQLNRDFNIPRKRLPWVKYLLQIAIPAFLFTSRGQAQTGAKLIGDTTYVEPARGEVDVLRIGKPAMRDTKVKTINGKITDKNGYPIPYASVTVKGTTSGVAANADGTFSINPFLAGSKATLVFSSVGFERKEIIVDTSSKQAICNMEMISGVLGGFDVVVVSKKPKKKKEQPNLFQRVFKDTVFKSFKVYPNPVLPGNKLTIELKRTTVGEYQADLMNQNGQVVYSTNLAFATKNQLNTISIPGMVAGAYFLRLTHKISGKSQVEKIIIQ
jgi:hypothetical protein